jgi:ribonucleotide monophosphatase NagD (HAD superfamily)
MLVERFDVFLLDLDGVVYLGDELLPHARESLARLRSVGKTVLFLTNDPIRGGPTVDQAGHRGQPAGDLRFGVSYGEVP